MEQKSKMDSKTFPSSTPCPGGKWKVGGVDNLTNQPLYVCSFCGEGPQHAYHLVHKQPQVGMSLNEYQQLAQRTAKPLDASGKFYHGCIGAASDAGELLTIAKAAMFYNKPYTDAPVFTNAIEEIGDVLWFLQEAAAGLGVDLEFVARANLRKLRQRYPDKYTDELAVARLDKLGTSNEAGSTVG